MITSVVHTISQCHRRPALNDAAQRDKTLCTERCTRQQPPTAGLEVCETALGPFSLAFSAKMVSTGAALLITTVSYVPKTEFCQMLRLAHNSTLFLLYAECMFFVVSLGGLAGGRRQSTSTRSQW